MENHISMDVQWSRQSRDFGLSLNFGSILNMKKMTRRPTTPGEILDEEFLKPMGLSQKQLADHIGVDVKVINRLVNERTAVTPLVAVKLGYALKTSPEFWLNAQTALDLHYIEEELTNPPKPLSKTRIAS
jgi:addiction module HigA family antidote